LISPLSYKETQNSPQPTISDSPSLERNSSIEKVSYESALLHKIRCGRKFGETLLKFWRRKCLKDPFMLMLPRLLVPPSISHETDSNIKDVMYRTYNRVGEINGDRTRRVKSSGITEDFTCKNAVTMIHVYVYSAVIETLRAEKGLPQESIN
jgi:hypothetical protein